MYSAIQYTGNGVTTDYAVPFPYLDKSHVEASVAAVSTAFTWVNASLIRFAVAPANGATVSVRRNSHRVARLTDYADSTSLTAAVLDRDANQLMYLVQESFDQSTAASYFSTDAHGARVVNMADPLTDTDGATKGWVEDYVTSLGLAGGGGDLLPLSNTWTGAYNAFVNLVLLGAGGAGQINPADVVTRELIGLNKGWNVVNSTNLAAEPGYGIVAQMRRTTGYALGYGGQYSGFGLGSWTGALYGLSAGAWRAKGSTGDSAALALAVVSTNPLDTTSRKYGLDLRFMNREEGTTTGGQAAANMAQSGDGTSSNYYNANSWAIQFTGQGRSDSNATFVGWNRGMRFFADSLDVMKPEPYSGAKLYKSGDYVSYGGTVYLCLTDCTGILPPGALAYWGSYGPSATVGAVGIDFAGVGATTASRMLGGIRLRGQMPIMWDSEGFCNTVYDPVTGRWTLRHQDANRATASVERFGIDLPTGDVSLGGTKRLLTTRSRVAAHRNYGVTLLGPSVWTQVVCATEELDDRAEYDAAGTGRFTPNTPGDYLIVWQVQTEASAAGGYRLYAGVGLNGAIFKAGQVTTVAGINTAHCSCLVRMNGAGDFITTHAYTTDPSVLSLTGEPSATYLHISKVQ